MKQLPMTPKRGRLRAEMPHTAAIIDQVREAFCETPEDHADLDAAMVRGMKGESGWFYAKEGEKEVGTK